MLRIYNQDKEITLIVLDCRSIKELVLQFKRPIAYYMGVSREVKYEHNTVISCHKIIRARRNKINDPENEDREPGPFKNVFVIMLNGSTNRSSGDETIE